MRRRRALAAALACAGVIALGLIYEEVRRAGAGIYEVVRTVPERPVAIVFGAGCRGRSLSPVLADRVAAGVDLYRDGKVRKLLMTGDERRVGCNEPAAMKHAAVQAGVPAGDVVCDGAGVRTYDSLYRARAVFGIRRAVLVTQRFHLTRALYLGRALGLDVIGLDAARRTYTDQARFDRREVLATFAAWLDVHLHRRPREMGKPEPL